MLVKDIMNYGAVTIAPNDTLYDAIDLVNEMNIGRLLVMKKGKLVGIVTNRDLRRAAPSNATTLEIHEMRPLLRKVKVSDIMTPKPVCVKQLETLSEAAKIMYEKRISGLPVIDQANRLVGVLSNSDILRSMIDSKNQRREQFNRPIRVSSYAKP